MPTVNYLRVTDSELEAANRFKVKELLERPPKGQEEAYEGLPIYQLIKITLQR